MTGFDLSASEAATAKRRDDEAIEMMTRVGVCLRLGTMHQLGNRALIKPMEDLTGAVNLLVREYGETRLQCVRDCFFVNRRIVKVDHVHAESVQMMRRVMRRLAVHEIAFRAELVGSDAQDMLRRFQERIWSPQSGLQPSEQSSMRKHCSQ